MNHPEANSAMDAAQLKADIVLLIDLITEHSRKVELVTHEDLQDEFLSKAPLQQPIPVSQIKAEYEAIPEMERKLRNKADDSPEEKERRRLISRRQMFGSLFSGELSLADLKEEPAEAESAPREITPEYFETVLAEVLKGQYGIEELTSWDSKHYYHFSPLLSASYARLLSTQNNPYEQILDTVRESSRVYPRPVGVFTFEFAPFRIDPTVIQDVLDRIAEDPNAKDIRVTVTSAGTVYLYSSTYLEDAMADFLAEEMDQGEAQML